MVLGLIIAVFGAGLATTGPDDEPGINGGFMHRSLDQAVINTLKVESLEEITRKIEAESGKVVHEPNEVPEVGTHAYFADPGGILFGVMQPAN